MDRLLIVDLASRATAAGTVPAVAPTTRTADAASAGGTSARAVDRGQRRRAPGRGRQPAPRQRRPQSLAGPMQPALDRADRAAEPPRRLLLRQALEVAEHHGRPIPAGQPGDLLVDRRPQFVPAFGVGRRGFVGGIEPFEAPDAGPLGPGDGPRPQRHPDADPVEPSPERIVHADQRGLAGEDEEHRLERIGRGVVVAQHPAADAQDHRAVPLHQGRKRRLGRGDILPAEEPRQQLGIRQPADDADAEQRLQVIADRSRDPHPHLLGSANANRATLVMCPATPRLPYFLQVASA